MAQLAVFFISSGRSGTQWLCDLLQSQFDDRCVARHETLQADYNIRKFIGNTASLQNAPEREAIDAHIRFIDEIDDNMPYIETGWTSVGVLPYLAEQLGDRFRVVQLTRHPVNTALSLSCQGMHQPGQNDSSEEWSFLDPSIAGTTCPELQSRWPEMSPYEKCLYQWYEIHNFGHNFARTLPDGRFMRATFEAMTKPDSGCLQEILDFCGVSGDFDLEKNQKKRVDRYPSVKPFTGDWRLIRDYDKFVSLAESFGYDFNEAKLDQVAARHGKRVAKKFEKFASKMKRHYRKYILRVPV